jgi:hypothetical protein
VGLLALQAFVALMTLQAVRVPGPVPAGWADLAFAAAGLAALIRLVQRRGSWPVAATLAALAYAGWVGLSAAVHRAGGWQALGALELALVLPVTHILVDDEAARERILRTWIWSSAVWCVAGLVSGALVTARIPVPFLIDGSGELGLSFRPAGLSGVGMLAAATLCPWLLLVTDGRRLVGRARTPLLILLTLTLALTLTRTLLAAAVGVVVWHALSRRHWRWGAPAIAGLVLLSLASMRLDLHGDRGALSLTSQPGIRWRIAASALANARANPLFGLGPTARAAMAGWPRASDEPTDWDAHDTPLDVAATRGLPALLFYAVAVALVVRSARRRERTTLQIALLAILAATLFDGLTVDLEDARHAWLLFALAA